MSQNAKILKPKRRFEWSKVWYYIRSLWSNQVATECGLNKKWYVGVIIAIFSIALSLIPTAVHTATSNGSSFLSTTSVYNYDEGFYSFLEDAKKNNYNIAFDRNSGMANLNGTSTLASNNYLLFEHKNQNNSGVTSIDFQVYYIKDAANFSDAATAISSMKVNADDGRDASYIIFGSKTFMTRLYKPGSYTAVGGVYGDYLNLDSNMQSLTSFYVTENTNRLENSTASLTKFRTFIDESYINNRKTLALTQTGIVAAVNVGITLLMGLVLFLMTRGKSNPNRGIKFQQCFSIGYWTSLAPAILALILGFMFTGYEIMLYVVIYGFRVMWLSMKTLSPNNGSVVDKK